jgi:hypothetical protein
MSENNPQQPTRDLPQGPIQERGPVITPPSPNLPGTPPERHPDTEAHEPPAPPPQPPTEPMSPEAERMRDPNYRGPMPTPGQPQSSRHGEPKGEPTEKGAKENQDQKGKEQSKDRAEMREGEAWRDPLEPDSLEELRRRAGYVREWLWGLLPAPALGLI